MFKGKQMMGVTDMGVGLANGAGLAPKQAVSRTAEPF